MDTNIAKIVDDINLGIKAVKDTADQVKADVEAGKKSIGEIKTEVNESLNNAVVDMEKKYKLLEATLNRNAVSKQVDSDLEKSVELFNSVSKNLRVGNSTLSVEQAEGYKDALETYLRKGSDVFGLTATLEQKSYLNTAIDPQGGYLIAPQYSSELISKKNDNRGILDAISVENVSGPIVEVVDWADYEDSYYSAELATPVDTVVNVEFGEITYNPKEQFYGKKFSRSLLEDAAVNIETHVLNKLRDGCVNQTADRVITGVANDGPRGLLTYAAGSNFGQVEQFTSTNTGLFSWEDVLDILPSSLNDALA